jgi:putative transposase
LARDFVRTAPDQAWVGDITYVPTGEGWLYLAVLLDLYSRRVVGWSMSPHIDRHLALGALTMAVAQRGVPRCGVLHHSDRGSQYASEDYRDALAQYGFQSSMSRKGNCWDNAVSESFFSTIKTELVHQKRFATRLEARQSIFEYIEVFYNRQRRHSTLGYLSPVQFEEKNAGIIRQVA